MSTEQSHSFLEELSSKMTAYLCLSSENKYKTIADLLFCLEGMLNRMANPQNRPAENTFQEDLQCLLLLAERLQATRLLAAAQKIKDSMSETEEEVHLAINSLLQQVQEGMTYLVLASKQAAEKGKLF